MTCADTQPVLEAYHDRALPEERARQVQEHLAACAPCRNALERLSGLDRLVRSSAPAGMPAWAAGRLKDGLAAPPAARRFPGPSFAAAAAGLLAVSALGWWAARAPGEPAPLDRPAAPLREARLLGREGRYHLLACGAVLRLSADADVTALPGEVPVLRLAAGSVSVESEARLLRIETPAGAAAMEAGWLVAGLPPPPATSLAALLMPSAEAAGEAALDLTVIRGSAALLLPDGERLEIPEGAGASWRSGERPRILPADPEGARRLAAAWSAVAETGWQDLLAASPAVRDGAAPAGDGWLLASDGGGATLGYALGEGPCVLEARLLPESVSAKGDLGVAYRAWGRRPVWWLRGGMTGDVLGADPLAEGRTLTVRIWVSETELLVSVNGLPCARVPRAAVEASPAASGGRMDAGILATLGRFRVKSLRWRAL